MESLRNQCEGIFIMFPWIDTHCHLNAVEFEADRDTVLLHCAQQNVKSLIIPAVIQTEMLPLVDFCRKKQVVNCFPALGLHPIYIDQHQESALLFLRQWVQKYQTELIAIGEIGLDFYLPHLDRSKQIEFFVSQLKIAQECDLPVLVHARKSIDLVLKYIRQSKVRKGIIHAFNGSFDQAMRLYDLGFKFGFGGTVTYSNARHIHQLIKTLPLDSLVLETDAPDMPPAFLAGDNRRHSPEFLPAIAKACCFQREISLSEFNQAIYHNTCVVFDKIF